MVVKVPGTGVTWSLQLHDDELGSGVGAVDVAAGVDGGDLGGLLSIVVVTGINVGAAVQKSVEEKLSILKKVAMCCVLILLTHY